MEVRKDSKGCVADFNLVNKRFKHFDDGQIYRVTGFKYDNEKDLHTIVYHQIGAKAKRVMIELPVSTFFEHVPNGILRNMVPRFTQVENQK